jgi:hypothetical protein
MKKCSILYRCFVTLAVACASLTMPSANAEQPHDDGLVVLFDFSTGSQGWLPDFTDYPLEIADLDRLAEIRKLPKEVHNAGNGYYLQGDNHSDDLFMYLKKPLVATDGIQPNQAYDITFRIEFASNAPEACSGIGGAPGESVYLKLGASTVEPVPILENFNVLINVDKGFQSASGRDAQVVSNIANGLHTPCDQPQLWRYVLLRRSLHFPHPVKSDSNGALWIFLGTDSGFEGLTGVYYHKIAATLKPVS